MVYEIFFCSEFPDFLDKAGKKNDKKKNTGNCKALSFSCKSNTLLALIMPVLNGVIFRAMALKESA